MNTQESIQLLRGMFDEWDEETLALVLSTCDGNAEAAIDVVLSAGSPQEFRAQQVPMQHQHQASTSGSGSNDASARNAARDAAVAEQERMFALANSPRSSHQFQQLQPTTTTVAAGAGSQEMLKVVAPPGGAAGAVLSIKHNGADFFVTVPAGVRPGQEFLVNVPRRAAGSNSGGGGAARAGSQDQRQLQAALSGFGGGPPQQPPPSSRSSASSSSSSAGPSTPKGRGALTILPDNFLRPPGWKPSAAIATQQRIGATSTSSSGGAVVGGDGAASTDFAAGLSDDQLAILLQDEAFLTELRNQPDFLAMQEELYNHPQGLRRGQAGAPPSGSLPAAARPGPAGYPGSGSRSGGSSGSGGIQGQQEGAAGGAGWSTGMRSRLANLGAKFTRPKPSSSSSGSAPGAAGRHYGGASGEYGALPSPTSGGYHDDDDGLQEVSFSAISTTRDSTSGLELSSTPSTEPSGSPSQGRSEAVPAAAGGGCSGGGGGGGSGGGPVPRLPPPPSHGGSSGGTSLGGGEEYLFSVLGAPGAVPAEDAAVALQASELAAVSSPSAAAGRGKTRRNARSPPSHAGVESEDL